MSIDQDRPSPPPSWYEPTEYVECAECGDSYEYQGEDHDLCGACIKEIRAEQALDAMREDR